MSGAAARAWDFWHMQPSRCTQGALPKSAVSRRRWSGPLHDRDVVAGNLKAEGLIRCCRGYKKIIAPYPVSSRGERWQRQRGISLSALCPTAMVGDKVPDVLVSVPALFLIAVSLPCVSWVVYPRQSRVSRVCDGSVWRSQHFGWCEGCVYCSSIPAASGHVRDICRHPVGCRICAAGMLARAHRWPTVSRRSSGPGFTTSGRLTWSPLHVPKLPRTVSLRRRGGSPAVSRLGGN